MRSCCKAQPSACLPSKLPSAPKSAQRAVFLRASVARPRSYPAPSPPYLEGNGLARSDPLRPLHFRKTHRWAGPGALGRRYRINLRVPGGGKPPPYRCIAGTGARSETTPWSGCLSPAAHPPEAPYSRQTSRTSKPVIANQRARWCGNPLPRKPQACAPRQGRNTGPGKEPASRPVRCCPIAGCTVGGRCV